MKKILMIGGLLMALGQFSAQSISPTDTKNYIYTKDCLDADCIKKAETVQYFDGLGRPKQIVGVKASPAQKDVVGHIEYDPDGRVSKSYLPVPQSGTQNGAIYENPLNNATNPEIYGSEKIYSRQVLENLPLARVKEAYNVGNAWSDKPVKYGYNTNTSASEVKKYGISTTWIESRTNSELSFTGAYYPVNSLMKTTVTDEDNNSTTEYKNGKGQVVLIRKNDGTHDLDTYYVYNEYNQLAYVIPPLASPLATIDEANRNSLCYQYRYDEFGRMVEKRIPGKGWEYLVYDKQDRVVLTQDAMLGTTTNNFGSKGWMFTKYDKFGRVVYTGFFTNTATRSAMQTAINNMAANAGNNEERSTTPFTLNGMDVYYTKNAFPTGSMTVLSVNYYDTYPPFPNDISTPAQVLGQDVLTQDAQNSSISTKTLPTASYVKNVENDSWTRDFVWYDKKGRTIGVYSLNHLGGYTKTETEVDFMGVTQRSVTKHKRVNADTERIVTETFEYDPQDRLLVHKHQVDSNPVEILAQNTYNELSQVKNKKVGGISADTPLQDINYAYNIRGWMTKINDPKNLGTKLFGYEIKYNQVEGEETPNAEYTNLQVKPRYNGNIAEVDWRTNTTTGDYLRRYGYVYDNANRLSAGFYQRDDNPTAQEYFEKMDYDLNGNITHLKRTAEKGNETVAAAIDNLTYEYVGNRLFSVTDSSHDYRGYPDVSGIAITYYEENGNMKSHKDKGILDIKYNYLDLPNRVTFDKTYVPRFGFEGLDYNVNTQYVYRADGVKLRKSYTYGAGKANTETTTITEYLDGFQYETVDTGGKPTQSMPLKFVPTAEGYYNFENNKYIYSYTDHLGNVRLSYTKGTSGAEIIEENNYYPFGLKHEGYNPTEGNPYYKYQYNGKELQTESGMLDYGWRQYMPEIGRWNGIDQLSELYSFVSPYAYVANNPIMMFDPDGRKSEVTHGDGDPGKKVEWNPNKPGGANNPALIEEVVVGQITEMNTSVADSTFLSFLLQTMDDFGTKLDSSLSETFFGIGSRRSMNAYQGNLSRFQLAVTNSKAAMATEEAEQFLFLELPASFMGGEFLSAGWRALSAGWKAAGISKFFSPFAKGALQYGTQGDIFLMNAAKIPKIEGVLDVAVHGASKSVEIGELTVNHRFLANLISRNPEFTGQPIRLLSCNTGKLANGFAQNLANKLGVPVYAPNNIIWAFSNGSFSIGSSPFINSGSLVKFVPGL